MPNETTDLFSIIKYYTSDETKNWRKLLELGDSLNLNNKRTFLWIWPTEDNLYKLKNHLKSLNIQSILSIGCGSGLLEWIVRESIEIDVYGLEVDRSWWQSKYAVNSFIELNFIDDLVTNGETENRMHFLQNCCHTKTWNFALLFCYFNNRDAFLKYLEMFKGIWIIIIGPRPYVGIHTDPSPMEPEFPNGNEWQLMLTLSIGACGGDDISNDVVAIYKKLQI